MRQTKLSEYPSTNRSRVTRGHSDLPKEEEQPESESSSESEEIQSSNTPKEKKIHHMTLKAMQRKKKLAEAAELLGIPLDSKPEPVQKIPKKRGRPKGFKVKKAEDKQDFQVNEIAVQVSETPEKKKQIVLRKRDPTKRIVDDDSEMIERDLQMMEQQSSERPAEVEVKTVVAVAKPEEPVAPAPKRRGRKKKVQAQPAPVVQAPPPVQKIYTVPKSQTYENYLKYYDQIMEDRHQDHSLDEPLIFDKFLDPEGYERLLNIIK